MRFVEYHHPQTPFFHLLKFCKIKMALNLKIQFVSILIGLFISIWWFSHEKKKVGLPLGAIVVLVLWMTGWAVYFSLEDSSLTFFNAIPRTLDINEFRFGRMKVIRSVDGMDEVNAGTFFQVTMICVYTSLFRWMWLMKNRRKANEEWLPHSEYKRK